MLIRAYAPALNDALGVYLPLITVNCIILGRAEMFASKNGVVASAIDGLSMGLGFTLTLVVMSSIRELVGAGQLLGFQILPESIAPVSIVAMPPGGFFLFGCLMALAIYIETKMGKKPTQEIMCGSCPAGDSCPAKGGNE